jgi:hypothetical protein
LHQLVHPRILAEDVLEAVLARQFLAQDRVLALEILDFDDAADQKRNLRRVARLDDVFLRAFLHRGHGGIDGGIGGDDDYGSIGLKPTDLDHGLDAVQAARHSQVDEVDRVRARARLADGFAARGRGIDGVTILPQPRGQRFRHQLLVIDDQDFPVCFHCLKLATGPLLSPGPAGSA